VPTHLTHDARHLHDTLGQIGLLIGTGKQLIDIQHFSLEKDIEVFGQRFFQPFMDKEVTLVAGHETA
jgi:hypothetical protein